MSTTSTEMTKPASSSPKGRILLIEDTALARQVITKLITHLGIGAVVEAETGEIGLSQFNADPESFDAVFVDWELPGKSGLDIVKNIRSRGYQLPIIMVTGESRSERVQTALASGITDYLLKPFKNSTFFDKMLKLQRQLELRRLVKVHQVRNAMTREVVSARPNMTLPKVAELLTENKISGMPVITPEGEVLGIVTESDVIEHLYLPGGMHMKAQEIMTCDVVVANEGTTLSDVALLMIQRRIRRLPVIHSGKLVGIIARRDLLKFSLRNRTDLERFVELLELHM